MSSLIVLGFFRWTQPEQAANSESATAASQNSTQHRRPFLPLPVCSVSTRPATPDLCATPSQRGAPCLTISHAARHAASDSRQHNPPNTLLPPALCLVPLLCFLLLRAAIAVIYKSASVTLLPFALPPASTKNPFSIVFSFPKQHTSLFPSPADFLFPPLRVPG